MIERVKSDKPFVSIGITTYKRHDLLRQTLDSVLAQTFTDFEVIVGNDYTAEVLTGEMLGITDPRVRFVNHPRNLREVGNMNALLGLATGRYFTWLFDDDLYELEFLQTAHDCLTQSGFPAAFLCSFRMIMGGEEFRPRTIPPAAVAEFTGPEFLRWYSGLRPQLFPTYGLFDTAVLRSKIGGFEELSNSAIGMYSEYLFLVKCALLDRMVYIDAPFYVYRQHEGSWSETNADLENYLVAGQEFIRRSSEVLRSPGLVDDYAENLFKICSLYLVEFAYKSGRYANYLPEDAQKKFGFKGVCRALSSHWRESLKTRKLYLDLGGARDLGKWFAFVKMILFCNYRMIGHFSLYFYRRRKA